MSRAETEGRTKGGLFKATMWLPGALWSRVRVKALEERRPAQEIVTEALQAYLKNQKGGRA